VAQVTAEPRIDRQTEAGAERRTSPLELLWDLVFVFAITQVTTLLSRHLDWSGFGHEKLVVAGALAILYAAGGGLSPWALAAVITALLVALCAVETVRGRQHGWARRAS
jgi:hypothetical protein